MRYVHPVVSSALEQLDPPVAAVAHEAFATLTDGGSPGSITQFRLQRFLWMHLPMSSPAREWETTAEALGRLLHLCGLERYAAICRSDETKAVLAAYKRSPKRGSNRGRKAEQRSGLAPPDLPVLQWSSFAGDDEAYAHRTVAETLELAILAGEVAPGSRGWRKQQACVANNALVQPRPELGGRSLLDHTFRERIQRWTLHSGEIRMQILEPIAERLLHPAPEPGRFPSLEWLLTASRDGIRVGTDDEPPTDLALSASRRFGWTPGMALDYAGLLLAVLTDMGALARTGRILRSTTRGRALADEPEALWRGTVRYLWDIHMFHAAVAELAFAVLLQEGPLDEDLLVQRIHPAVAETWRDSLKGEPSSAQEVRLAVIRCVFVADPLGVLESAGPLPGSGRWPNRRLALTDAGRTTALEVLRVRATAPVR